MNFYLFFSDKKGAGKVYPEVTPAVLPSSLAVVISFTLVFSTYPPVLVFGTETYFSRYRGFSCQLKSLESSRQSRNILHRCLRTSRDLPQEA